MILPCSCKHEYQDKEYEKGHRVHNSCVKGYRCTVCGEVKGSGQKEQKEEKVNG